MNARVRDLIIMLVVLVALLVVISAIVQFVHQTPATSIPPVSLTESPPPLPTAAQAAQAAQPFQLLVSYTDQGFEPASATIQVGDTVRFTNNSSHTLWIASATTGSEVLYPGTSTCGGSALDSCTSFGPGNFWEFTFTQGGTWGYQNNLNKSEEGEIVVATST